MKDTGTYGFPLGYFVIRSAASNRVLDVSDDSIEDGADVLLWPEKESSLVESFRDPNANNQVYFIDTSGALCSRSSGHAIDVEDDRLVLRHRRPISYPFPNAYSHPLPTFHYNSGTGEITVHFEYDPTYSMPPPPMSPSMTIANDRSIMRSSPANPAHNKAYFLVSQPLRKPRTIIDDASELVTTAITSPINFFSSAFSGKNDARPDEVFDGNIDLKEDEVVEEERGEEGEIDDSPESGRQVRVMGIARGNANNLGDGILRRKRWIVESLRTTNAKTGA
ncbi:hypothetical protein Agabi119p4_399 [Agaricus bisporus var. burnettii]|uniref:Uncharacterized protein n=1 Tax=Agaricus bisporus var. burnettii TaxID=192524 RepID=A0A8H7FAP4_AGABI|nr:hypothetical protein Agabi119p4_399 [Agaricus bisporus var. burnettii]